MSTWNAFATSFEMPVEGDNEVKNRLEGVTKDITKAGNKTIEASKLGNIVILPT